MVLAVAHPCRPPWVVCFLSFFYGSREQTAMRPGEGGEGGGVCLRSRACQSSAFVLYISIRA